MRQAWLAGALPWVMCLVVACNAGFAVANQGAGAGAPAGGTHMTNGTFSPAGDRHPGRIHTVDRANAREYDEAAEEVSQREAWVKVGDTWKAVVRVEVVGDAGRLEIRRFGNDGSLLETTTMVAPPSAPPARPTPVPVPTPDRGSDD